MAAPAMAADMAVKTPVYKAPPAAAVYSWTGFYVGGNLGYSWGRSGSDWNTSALNISGGNPACQFAGTSFCVTGTDTNKLNGAIGGVQAGYNWQTGQFLAGVETDFQWSRQRGSRLFNTGFDVGLGLPPGTLSANYTEKLAWLGTLRGRFGYAADRWLVYATGGLAYGRVSIDGTATATGSDQIAALIGLTTAPCAVSGPLGFGACPFASFSNSVNKVGWTLGAGAEGAIAGNWSWKIEYLHVDLGKVSTTFATLPGCYGSSSGNQGACTFAAAGSGTISRGITDEIVRVGINYRFGSGPVVASY
ncbi:MAG: outer membrane beta-barrel protein [Bradyrhizobium sp.]